MKVDVRTAQTALHGLSALCAVFGMAFVVVFLQKRWPDAHLLLNATIFATVSSVALMGGVVLSLIESLHRNAPADPQSSLTRSDRGEPRREAAA